MQQKETTADQEISRILLYKTQATPNPYEILAVPYLSTEEEIKRKYRQTALLIHPDKSNNPSASEAFNLLESSYKTITESDKKLFYKRLINTAKERAMIKRNEINKQRIKNGLNTLPEDTLEDEVRENINKILEEIEQNKIYEQNTLLMNQKRQRDMEETARKKEEEKKNKEKERDKCRDKGVRNWNRFKNRKNKKFNILEIKSMTYKSETRNEGNDAIVVYQEDAII